MLNCCELTKKGFNTLSDTSFTLADAFIQSDSQMRNAVSASFLGDRNMTVTLETKYPTQLRTGQNRPCLSPHQKHSDSFRWIVGKTG